MHEILFVNNLIEDDGVGLRMGHDYTASGQMYVPLYLHLVSIESDSPSFGHASGEDDQFKDSRSSDILQKWEDGSFLVLVFDKFRIHSSA